ncbi:MAG TPA: DUF971 domain-containing protein [Telluria sp.]|nr:DUF971 domain-containing protein [Telluria sp.]
MNPTDITVHQKSRTFDIAFDDGSSFSLPFEYMRVYSPSAEVRGHGAGQEVLQVGKRDVGIESVAPVGNYAIQPQFTDGHNTGLYTWDYLYRLGANYAQMWQHYLDRLAEAGFEGDAGRAPGAMLPGAAPAAPRGCGHSH